MVAVAVVIVIVKNHVPTGHVWPASNYRCTNL